jgi:hypothetical protein
LENENGSAVDECEEDLAVISYYDSVLEIGECD